MGTYLHCTYTYAILDCLLLKFAFALLHTI